MKTNINDNSKIKFKDLTLESEFYYEDKTYRKIQPVRFGIGEGTYCCANAVVIKPNEAFELRYFHDLTDVKTSVEPIFIKFKDLDIGDIFLHNGTVVMKIKTTTEHIVNNGLASLTSINSVDLSTGLFYKWFYDSDSVEKIIDYDFKIVRR